MNCASCSVGHGARQNLARAQPQDESDDAEHHAHAERREHGAQLRTAHGGHEALLHGVAVKRSLCKSSSVNACTVWMAFRVSPARPLVSAMRSWEARDNPRTLAPREYQRRDHRRDEHEDHPHQPCAGQSHQHQGPDEAQDRAQHDGEIDARYSLHQRGIGGQPREHLTDARDLEELHVHAHHPPVDGAAQIRHDALAHPGDQIETQRREYAVHHGRCQKS